VGLVLYEMLAGVGPFDHLGTSGSIIAQAHLRDLPPPVSKFAPWVPPSIVELIASALAKEPRQRPRDAYAFAERLFELEWANDGKDPSDRDATMEGPLSRILSTAGGDEKPSSKKLVAAGPPRDRLGNVPLIGVPAEVRREGPTLQGMGARSGAARDLSSPGEDTLLAGLDDRPQTFPLRVKKARASDPQVAGVVAAGNGLGVGNAVHVSNAVQVGPATPRMPDVVARGGEAATLDAPPSAPPLATAHASGGASAGAGANAEATSASFFDGTTRKRPAVVGGDAAPARPSDTNTNTDTFASQESDARRASKDRTGRMLLPIALVALVLLAVGTFAALRTRSPAAASGAPATNAATNSNANVDTNASAASASANANAAAASANANAAALPSAALAPTDTAQGAPIPSAMPVATRPTRKGGGHVTGAGARGDATASPPGGMPAAIPSPPTAPATPTATPKTPGTPAKPDESLIRSL
jgi:serine/threonine-protein kinase